MPCFQKHLPCQGSLCLGRVDIQIIVEINLIYKVKLEKQHYKSNNCILDIIVNLV
jgi:hypothetical protein